MDSQPLVLKPVRQLRQFSATTVLNAVHACGYRWPNPRRTPTKIDHLVLGLPRPVLQRVLHICQHGHSTKKA